MTVLGPRVVIAGTSSGVGKTTITTGLLAALRAAGHRPAAAKVGPDFIDPGYHHVACGRPPRNLDAWLCGPGAVAPLAGRAAESSDLLVVEGVMGLFDGAADGSPSSTADVARLLDAPVLLVVDASAMSGSVAAVVHGFATIDPTVAVSGVILNRIASESHERQLRAALASVGVPVVGALHRDDLFGWRDRHLGLVPVAEDPQRIAATVDRLASAVAAGVDLEAVVGVARRAPARTVHEVALPMAGPPVTIAVAAGKAFTFTYADTVDALHAAGAEVVTFDPLDDERLPDGAAGLIVGGGFPEVHVGDLAANEPLLADVRAAVRGGLPVWAECGGLLWLCRDLDGRRLVAAIEASGRMTDRLTLGYRTAVTGAPSPVGGPGTMFRCHEFHYSSVDPAGTALALDGRTGRRHDGFASPSMLATFAHHHPGGDPVLVERFLATVRAAAPLNRSA